VRFHYKRNVLAFLQYRLGASVLIVALLAGCGGGGSTTPTSPTHSVATPPSTTAAYNAGSYAGKKAVISSISNLPPTPADTGTPAATGNSSGGGYIEPPGGPKGTPNFKYFNYCGPGASRVLIAAWKSIVPTITVPFIDQLATDEYTNVHSANATLMQDMAPLYPPLAANAPGPINSAIGQNYYITSQVGSQEVGEKTQRAYLRQGDFSNMIGKDILDNNHPSITGIQTQGPTGNLIGWKLNAAHIVTIFGFDFTSPSVGYIYYYETSNPDAMVPGGSPPPGFAGPGPQKIDYNLFWNLVKLNNTQLTSR
jgi:hypothetical protein